MRNEELVSFADVRVGDVICALLSDIGTFEKVVVAIHHERIVKTNEAQIAFDVQSLALPHAPSGIMKGHPDAPVILVRRARPGGTTEEEMLANVAAHAREVVRVCTTSALQEAVDHVTDPEPVLEALRSVLRDYRLRKPLIMASHRR